jgi:Asp-tRNA(Asn)/Glu-tRNA(Gln) amidotransferase A subunit family amidase
MPDGLSPLFWPVAELVAAYRRGDLSPVDVAEEAIVRIERFNLLLNAVLARLDEQARRQAKAAEQAYRDGTPGPLSGVPVSVKDTFFLAGAVTTFGSALYRDHVADHDSGVVRRLRAAGAMFTGKTNAAEFGQSGTTDNRLGEDCRNPWDLTRTTGGSSGGAVASVAAGLANVAVGADGGGSIRIPAAFTGLFGLKPTYGLVPDEDGFSAMSDFICAGPFAWRVADARVVLGVLADTGYPRRATPRGLRIAWWSPARRAAGRSRAGAGRPGRGRHPFGAGPRGRRGRSRACGMAGSLWAAGAGGRGPRTGPFAGDRG